MTDESYGDEGAGQLQEILRGLAEHSALIHFEVRCTFDTPEIAKHRRLVDEAWQTDNSNWERSGWSPDDDEEIEW